MKKGGASSSHSPNGIDSINFLDSVLPPIDVPFSIFPSDGNTGSDFGEYYGTGEVSQEREDELEGDDVEFEGASETGVESAEQLKAMKRAKNKLHARESRIRKRIRISVMQDQLKQCWLENEKLKRFLMTNVPDKALSIIDSCAVAGTREYTLNDMMGQTKPAHTELTDSEGVSGLDLEHIFEDSTSGTGNKKNKVPAAEVFVPPVLNHPDSQYFNFLSCMEETYVVWDPLTIKTSSAEGKLSILTIPIVFASPTFCKLTGYASSDIMGHTCEELLFGSGTDATMISTIDAAVNEGREGEFKILNYTKDKVPFWNHFHLSFLRDSNSKIMLMVGLLLKSDSTVFNMDRRPSAETRS